MSNLQKYEWRLEE